MLVLLLFFFSGASGLVYQVIWVRLLTRIFGSTTFAVSALLAAFMAGLGLGSLLASRYLGRVRQPLRWFGALEIGVGMYALLLNALLPWSERLFLGVVSGVDLSFYGESLAKVALSFLILVPPGPKAADLTTTSTNYLEITKYAQPVTPYLEGADVSRELLTALDERFAEKKADWDNARSVIVGDAKNTDRSP